jgi:hypothetical protein
MTPETSPRRRYPRIASQHTVLLKTLSGEPVEEFAATKTIAIGGCSFTTSERVAAGASLELLIAVEGGVISARGRVVYQNDLPDGRRDIGVEFTALDDTDAERIAGLFEKPLIDSV